MAYKAKVHVTLRVHDKIEKIQSTKIIASVMKIMNAW